MYHLYYAVSTFGSNKSCIGHATRASARQRARWADQGNGHLLEHGTTDDWNAIDPNIVVDEGGDALDGLRQLLERHQDRQARRRPARAPDTRSTPSRKARRGRRRRPVHLQRCGYYYLFVSFGRCCGEPVRLQRFASGARRP